MPNRFLKESICTSETIDQLTPEQERAFYRLLVSCDDYGRTDARPAILRAKLFPLRVESISLDDIRSWMQALQDAGLITVYVVKGRPYLEVVTWGDHQNVRALKSRWPSPLEGETAQIASIGTQLHTDENNSEPMRPLLVSRISSLDTRISHDDVAPDGAVLAPEKKPKRPDQAIWDAFVEAVGNAPETLSERGKWNKGIGELRSAGVSVDDIPDLVTAYRSRFKSAACNPRAIANNLSEVRSQSEHPAYVTESLADHDARLERERTSIVEAGGVNPWSPAALAANPPFARMRTNGHSSARV